MPPPEGHWHYESQIDSIILDALKKGYIKRTRAAARQFVDYWEARVNEAKFLLRADSQRYVRYWLADAQTWQHYWNADCYTEFPVPRPADMAEADLRRWRAMNDNKLYEESPRTHRGRRHRGHGHLGKTGESQATKPSSSKEQVEKGPPPAPSSARVQLPDEAELEAQIAQEVKEAFDRAKVNVKGLASSSGVERKGAEKDKMSDAAAGNKRKASSDIAKSVVGVMAGTAKNASAPPAKIAKTGKEEMKKKYDEVGRERYGKKKES